MSRRRCRCGTGAPCAGCTPPSPAMAARHVATTGRFLTAPTPADDGQFGRSFERNFDVQALTGFPVSTVPEGRWSRGVLYRQAMPTLRLVSMGPMLDPTDPRTWPTH